MVRSFKAGSIRPHAQEAAPKSPFIHPHKVITTVSIVTKRLNGVTTLVVFDRDYEDGKFAGAPSTWIAGRWAVSTTRCCG